MLSREMNEMQRKYRQAAETTHMTLTRQGKGQSTAFHTYRVICTFSCFRILHRYSQQINHFFQQNNRNPKGKYTMSKLSH